MKAIDVLIECTRRPLHKLAELGAILVPEVLNTHPAEHDNSIAWLLWHTGREIDAQLSDLTGLEQAWTRGGHRSALGLGHLGDTVGYGHTPQEARTIVVTEVGPLVAYVEETLSELLDYLSGLEDEELGEVVDDRWDPPVTLGVRLVSIIDDAVQHLAQAAYAAGTQH